jgi:hypothetical protein
LKTVDFRSKVDLAAVILLGFSLFGFLGNVMIDYNWGTNFLTNSFSLIYSMTLGWLIPFPVGYWGVGAVIYFSLFLFSYAFLNRKAPFVTNFLQTIGLASAVLLLFEIGLYLFVPEFMDTWVIAASAGTPLQYFTNTDLFVLALGLLASSQFLVRFTRSRC